MCSMVPVRANEARQKLLAYATKELGVVEGQLRIKDGAISETANPENSILISDLMRKTQIEDMSLCEQIIGSAAGVAPAMPGCFGWRNMLKAAQTDNFWQRYPFRCSLTGMTLKIDGKINLA
ncbi:MAG: hypothetical protein WBM69_22645 [Desulfobacterales bacterium]